MWTVWYGVGVTVGVGVVYGVGTVWYDIQYCMMFHNMIWCGVLCM